MRWKLIAILCVGFAARVVGIHFGLPELTHADEPIVVNHAAAYGSWDFNPHFFKIPPLVSYLLFFIYGVMYLIGRLAGVFHSVLDFETLFLTDPTFFYLTARLVFGAVFGTATIYLVYLFADRIWKNKTISLLSALFFSLVFLHVRNSHYVYADIPMIFFVMLAMISVQRLYARGRLSDYLWAGCWGGLAAGAKYNAALIALSILIAHLFCAKRSHQRLVFSALVMIGVYLITNPYTILDFQTFVSELVSQAGAEERLSAFFHLRYSLAEGVGLPLLVSGLLGFIWFLFKNRKEALVFFSFPVVFYIFCIYVSQPHARYMLPVTPFLAILAAYFLTVIPAKAPHRIYLLAFLVILPSAVKMITTDYLFTRGDTRTDAKRWIENHLPANTKIALDHTFFLPKLNRSPSQLRDLMKQTDSSLQKKRIRILMDKSKKEPAYRPYYMVLADDQAQFLFSRPVIARDVIALKKEGIQYVLVHRRTPAQTIYLDEIERQAELIQSFSPYRNPNKVYSKDPDVNTAAPFLSEEIYSRRKLGYTLQLYKLL